MLVVIVGFPLFGHPRENSGYSFRVDSFNTVLFFYIIIMENHHTYVFSNLFASWQETFADARDGDLGGDHLGPF